MNEHLIDTLYRYKRLIIRGVHQVNSPRGVSKLVLQEERRCTKILLTTLLSREPTLEEVSQVVDL